MGSGGHWCDSICSGRVKVGPFPCSRRLEICLIQIHPCFFHCPRPGEGFIQGDQENCGVLLIEHWRDQLGEIPAGITQLSVPHPWCWWSSTSLLLVKHPGTAFIVPQGPKPLFVQNLEVILLTLSCFLEVFFTLETRDALAEQDEALGSYFSLQFFWPVWSKLGKKLKGNVHGVAIWERDASMQPAGMAHLGLFGCQDSVILWSLCKASDRDWGGKDGIIKLLSLEKTSEIESIKSRAAKPTTMQAKLHHQQQLPFPFSFVNDFSMREKNPVTLITKPDKHPAVQQADPHILLMAKVRFQLPKSSLDTKQEENPALCDTASSVCSKGSLTHLPHMSPESEGRQWGPAIVLQLLRIFIFIFPSQKRIAFCMVTPLHPKGQQREKCSHSWNTIVLRFPLQPVLISWWDISPWRWQLHLLQEWMGKDLCCSSPQEHC